jgi:3-oxoadipate enol-lactonase
MRETMKNVVAESLEADMARIKVPTLLVWGEEDRTTPLWQAKIIRQLIVGSELKVINGGNHGLPYKMPEKTAEIIIKYLK